MMKKLTAVTLAMLLAGCQMNGMSPAANAPIASVTKSSANAEVQQLDELIEQIWQYEISTSPLMASSVGNHKWDDQLVDMSPQALAKRDKQYRVYAQKLEKIDVSQLDTQSNINFVLIKRRVESYINDYKLNKHYVPLTAESGFHSYLSFLPKSTRLKTVQDHENYIARLKQIPRYFNEQVSWMRKGIETGLTQPKAVLVGFEDSISAFVVKDPTQSVYFSPFIQLPEHFSEQDKARLISAARDAVNLHVMPAFENFYQFMVDEYKPAARDDIAISSVTGGKAYYDNEVKYYTTLDITPEEVHNIGLEEVKRIRSEMEDIIKEVNFKGDFSEFVHFLRTDPQFYATSAEELLKEASYIAKKMDAKLPSLFKHMPRTPYGVAPVPDEIAPKYTTGRYVSPSRDDQPGYYWVNTYSLERRPLYVLEALTLHEAVPGHHFQSMIARELENVPEFRKGTYLSAFGEGWGLYSEYLGIEAGFYQDPYSRFGRLTYEMWRACRLVVDTGMHIKGWSRQQAMDFLASNTALSLHNVKTEIDRYISWPGQALSYKLGEITIKRLRKKAETELAEQFDLRDFHDAVLKNGSVPLYLLEQQIEQFIEQVKSKS